MSSLMGPSPPLDPLPSAFHLPSQETKDLGVAKPGNLSAPSALDAPAASFLAGCQNVLLASTFLAALPLPLFKLRLPSSHPHCSGWGAPGLFLPATFLPG